MYVYFEPAEARAFGRLLSDVITEQVSLSPGGALALARWRDALDGSASAERAASTLSDAINEYFDDKFARRLKSKGAYTTVRR